MNEQWSDIYGFEGLYQISNFGQLKSVDRVVYINHPTKPYYRNIKGRILTPNKDKDGYLVYTLTNGELEKNMKIHRLVATAFVENSYGYEQVNHIDGNKANNTVENLEWCNNLYNQIHAYKIGLKRTQPIAQVEINTYKIIKIFPSLPSIRDSLDVDLSTIIKVCKNKRSHHKGFIWRYATPDMKVGDRIYD